MAFLKICLIFVAYHSSAVCDCIRRLRFQGRIRRVGTAGNGCGCGDRKRAGRALSQKDFRGGTGLSVLRSDAFRGA